MPHDDPVEPKATTLDPSIDFLAGTIAGAAGLVVGQPFDTIKVRFQSPSFTGRYGSTWDAMRAIAREERVGGLFKGITSPMAGIALMNGIIFASYGFFMKVLHVEDDTKAHDSPPLWKIGLAGTGSGFVAAVVTTPTELIKIRQQQSRHPLGTIAVFKEIVRACGVRGLYRGYGVTSLRELGYGPYFIAYEGLCRFFRNRKAPSPRLEPAHSTLSAEELHQDSPLLASTTDGIAETDPGLSWPELMFAGGAAGAIAWMATFPFDVLKTRIQGGTGGQRSVWAEARAATRAEGAHVLVKGLAPTLIRAVPANMVIFLTFEGVTSFFQ